MKDLRSAALVFGVMLAAVQSIAALSSSTIDHAMDLGFYTPAWSYELGTDAELTFEYSDHAVGNAMLKVSVPPQSTFALRWATRDEATIRFDLRLESGDLTGATVTKGEGIVLGPLAESGLAPQRWVTRTLSFLESDEDLVITIPATPEASTNRVFYLDNWKYFKYLVLAPEAYGVTVEVNPETGPYRPGGWVRLEAVPLTEDHRFLHWNDTRDSNPIRWFELEDDYPRLPIAVGGQHFELDNLEIVIPSYPQGFVGILSEEGFLKQIQFPDRIRSSFIRLHPKVDGWLRASVRIAEDAPMSERGRFAGKDLDREWSYYSIWIAPGVQEFDLDTYGMIEIDNLRLESGDFIEVSAKGEGTTSSEILEDAETGKRDLLSTATPAEGWYFARWSGTRESSETTIRTPLDHPVKLTAHFERLIPFAGIAWIISDSSNWEVVNDGDHSFVQAPDDMMDAQLGWHLEGPGLFTLRYSAPYVDYSPFDAQLAVNGQRIEALQQTAEDVIENSIQIEVPAGRQLLEIDFDRLRDVDFRILGTHWEPGYPVAIEATPAGGTIFGVPQEGRVEAGQVIEIEAKPSLGNSFVRWDGDFHSRDARLILPVHEAMNLRAQFARPVEDLTFTRTEGDVFWQKSDGQWTGPDTLPAGHTSRLIGQATGPAKLHLRLGEGNYLYFGMVGQPSTQHSMSSGSTATLEIPEGEHEFYVEARGTGDRNATTEPVLSTAELQFEVDLGVAGGSLTTTPNLPTVGDENPRHRGWIAKGTELTIRANSRDNAFHGWSRSLSGHDAVTSVVVNESIISTASFRSSTVSAAGMDWTVDDGREAWTETEPVPHIGFIAGEKAIAFTSVVHGPQVLSFAESNIDEPTVLIDGTILDSSFRKSFQIPDGEHEVTIRVPAGSPDASPYRTQYLKIVAHPGYLLGYPWNHGGIFAITPNLNSYIAGTEVSVRAQPFPNNEFVDWDPPFSGQLSPFTFTISEATTIGGQFRAKESIRGFNWTYTGQPPIYAGAPDLPYGTPGVFRFDLKGNDSSALTRNATTTLAGPAAFSVKWWSDSTALTLPERTVEFGLNGEFTAVNSNTPHEVVIPEGTHEISWQVRPPVDLTDAVALFLEFPKVQGPVTVQATADGIALAPESGAKNHATGDELVFVAPEFNSAGQPFEGWVQVTNKGSWDEEETPLTGNTRLEITVTGTAHLRARYRIIPIAIKSLLIDESDRFNTWIEDPDTLDPDGAPAINPDRSTDLNLAAVEDVYLRFALKTDERSAYSLVRGNDPLFYENTDNQWIHHAVFLRQGETLRIRLIKSSQEEIWLGSFSAEPGWGPTIIGVTPDALNFEPDYRESAEGETVTIEANPATNTIITLWTLADGTFHPGASIQVENGSSDPLYPVVGNDEWTGEPPLEFKAENRFSWHEIEGEEGVAAWRIEAGYLELENPALQLRVTGPTVLSYKLFTNFHDLDFPLLLDGVPYPEPAASDGVLVIPEGAHELTLIQPMPEDKWETSSTFVVKKLTPGYQLTTRPGTSNDVKVDPDKAVYSEGERVTVSLRDRPGYTFVDWESPFQGRPRTFVWEVDQSTAITPRWNQNSVGEAKFECVGYEWTYKDCSISFETPTHGRYIEDWGVYMDRITRVAVIKSDSEDTPGWIETQIEGPSVVRLQSVGQNNFTIDGVTVEYVQRENGQYVAIPDGTHSLRIEGPFEIAGRYPFEGPSGFVLSDYNFDVTEGYLVNLLAHGFPIEVTPHEPIHERGARINIQMPSGLKTSQIEWSGLPPDISVSDSAIELTVNHHISANLFFWRPRYLFGHTFGTKSEHNWLAAYQGAEPIFNSPNLSHEEWESLRFVAPYAGALRFEFDLPNPDHRKVLRSFTQNGVSMVIDQSAEDWEQSLAVAAGDELVWKFRYESDRIHYDNVEAAFVAFEYIPNERSAYDQYWRDHGVGRLIWIHEMEPQYDLDGDGWPNFLEFLLGMDPGSGELALVPVPPTVGGLDLWHIQLPGPEWIIEKATDPAGPWIDASDGLGTPIPDANFSGYEYTPVSTPIGDSSHLYWRIRYTGEIPDLESALSN